MEEEVIVMRQKELERLKVIELLITKRITQLEAAKRLKITDRRVRDIVKQYQLFGNKGVISKKFGKASNHQLSQDTKNQVIELIHSLYQDYGPTLVTEKLQENHGITLSVEVIRQLMIREHLWIPRKGPTINVHQPRPRRWHFGELIQMDGSEHHWFENRGPECTLLVLIDDATSTIVAGLFTPTESLTGYFRVVKQYFLKIGCPLAFYCDRFSVFETARKKDPPEEQSLTQFGRAMKELDIKVIHAYSPQAKGRVERVNRTLQDRLVKDLRERNISNIEEANEFLEQYFVKHNKRFSKPSAQQGNIHRPLSEEERGNLDRILSRNYQRTVQKDLTFQYNNDLYLIKPDDLKIKLIGRKITLWQDAQGKLCAMYLDKRLNIKSLKEVEYQYHPVSKKELLENWKSRKQYKPGKKHPYKGIWRVA